jgi:choline dehydrogenase-like flavoprotein
VHLSRLLRLRLLHQGKEQHAGSIYPQSGAGRGRFEQTAWQPASTLTCKATPAAADYPLLKLLLAGIEKQRQILEAAGAEVTWVLDDTAHLRGACRIGTDRQRSVVDQWCRSWDVPNLFSCDGSVFVTSAAVNPGLTIKAIAARTAAYITANARSELFQGQDDRRKTAAVSKAVLS